MKSVFYAMFLGLVCSVGFASDCCGRCCRTPVRSAVSAATNVVGGAVGVVGDVARGAGCVLTAPVRVTRNVVANSRTRRCCRRGCR